MRAVVSPTTYESTTVTIIAGEAALVSAAQYAALPAAFVAALTDDKDLADVTSHDQASEIAFTPVGSIAAIDTQTAVAEVATDAAAALATHEADTTAVHGITNTAELAALVTAMPTSAWTQTYATADKTVANPTSAALIDNSGGASAGGTIAAIGGAIDPTAALKVDTANAIATLAAMVNKLTADVLAMKKNDTALVDDLQALGLAG